MLVGMLLLPCILVLLFFTSDVCVRTIVMVLTRQFFEVLECPVTFSTLAITNYEIIFFASVINKNKIIFWLLPAIRTLAAIWRLVSLRLYLRLGIQPPGLRWNLAPCCRLCGCVLTCCCFGCDGLAWIKTSLGVISDKPSASVQAAAR